MVEHSFSDLTRQREFMRMWMARLFGTTGNQMLMVAVGWQMYELTGSSWDLGLVGLYQFAPALLLTLVAGHLADRLHRGRIVAVCLAAQALVALVLVLLMVVVDLHKSQESYHQKENGVERLGTQSKDPTFKQGHPRSFQ